MFTDIAYVMIFFAVVNVKTSAIAVEPLAFLTAT